MSNTKTYQECIKKVGFTLVEICIASAIGIMLLLVFHTFFSASIRSTTKGQDTLESIRAASKLFNQIRKDLVQSSGFYTSDTASITLSIDDTSIPTTLTFADSLSLSIRGATVTYSLLSTNQGKYVERKLERGSGAPTETKIFGIPRIVRFEAAKITKYNKIMSRTPKVQLVIINLVVDSKDPRFPTKEVYLTSIFLSHQLQSTDWNYFFNL